MPEVTVRKRLGRRSGSVQFRVRRWLYYRRTTVAVAIAALLAIGLAMAFWAMLSSVADTEPPEPVATAQ